MQNSLPTPSVVAAAGARVLSRFRSKVSADDDELADGAVIVKSQPELTAPSTKQASSLEGLLERAGVKTQLQNTNIRAAVTTTSLLKTQAVNDEIKASANAKADIAATIAAPKAPRVALTAERAEAARTFVENVDRAMGNALAQAQHATRMMELAGKSQEEIQAAIRNLSADQLLAEFLKLNISDPNENVETLNTLYDLTSKMRQMAIEEAKKKIENAQELMREAQKYADQVEQYADIAGILGMVMGIMGPLGAIMSAMMQIVVAMAQYQAQMMMADAKEERNNGERFNFMADMHQDQVQDTGEIISDIVQRKNDMVDSVIQMLQSSFATQQQLMSAAIAR